MSTWVLLSPEISGLMVAKHRFDIWQKLPKLQIRTAIRLSKIFNLTRQAASSRPFGIDQAGKEEERLLTRVEVGAAEPQS